MINMVLGTKNDDAGFGWPVLNGTAEDDRILGFLGSDILFGGDGDDFLIGGDDYDQLDGGADSDVVFGGDGDDELTWRAADHSGLDYNSPNTSSYDVYYGGAGDDTLILDIALTWGEWNGSLLQQEIEAYQALLDAGDYGVKFVFTSLGLEAKDIENLDFTPPEEPDDGALGDPEDGSNQVIEPGGDENYLVTTGSGDDTIILGAGDDTVVSGPGNDLITSGDGDDIVQAGDGNDVIIGGVGGGLDIFDAGLGSDTVTYPSATASVFIDLRPGNTLVTYMGMTLEQILDATPGYTAADAAVAGYATGADIDFDVLIGIENATGGSGSDTILGNDNDNVLNGGSGIGADLLNGYLGSDSLIGGGGNDTLAGGEDDDWVDGGDGNDVIIGGHGNDTIDGGAGNDLLGYLDLVAIATGVNIDMSAGPDIDGFYQATDPFGTIDRFKNVEKIAGSMLDDTIIVDGSIQLVDGGFGDDVIDGALGGPFLEFFGGGGDDILIGGTISSNLFVFYDAIIGGPVTDTDYILGFDPLQDSIHLFGLTVVSVTEVDLAPLAGYESYDEPIPDVQVLLSNGDTINIFDAEVADVLSRIDEF